MRDDDAVRSASTRRRVWRNAGATATSRAAIGSSSSSSRGSAASARATATRCACPPESSPGAGRRAPPTPTCSSQCVRPRGAARRVPPRSRGPKATLSRTVRCGNSSGSCASERDLAGRAAARHAREPLSAVSVSVRPSSSDPAVVGPQQPGHDREHRRLAGAVGSEQRDRLAVADLEGDVDAAVGDSARRTRGVTARPVPAGRSRSPRRRPRPAPATARPPHPRRSRAAGRSRAAASG